MDIDFTQNSEALNITPDIYLRILQKAITQTTEDMKAFEQALPTDDYTKVESISHKLKGDYDNLRIQDMSAIAKEINRSAKAEQDKEKIAELFNNFRSCFEQLKNEVQKQAS